VLAGVLLLALVAAGAWWLSRDRDEDQVRKRIELLRAVVTKAGAESIAGTALGNQRLQGLLAERVTLTLESAPFQGTYSRAALASQITRARTSLEHLSFTIRDLSVTVEESERAIATCTLLVKARGRSQQTYTEAREIVVELERIDGDWLFTGFRDVQVLER
jgi:hypothetical protein